MLTLAIVLLLALFVLVSSLYRWKSLAHPGFWYALSWLACLSAYQFLVSSEFWFIPQNELLRNLSIFICATAIFFAVAVLIFRPDTKKQAPSNPRQPLIFDNSTTLTVFAVLSLAASIINWLALGPSLEGLEARRQIWLRGIPVITARLWYPYLLCYPGALIGGWKFIAYKLMRRRQSLTSALVSFAPLLSGFFWFLGTGGRQALGIVLLYYICGLCLGLSHCVQQGVLVYKRVIIQNALVLLMIATSFALIVSLSGRIRADYLGSEQNRLSDNSSLGVFAQAIEYTGISVAAFQLNPMLLYSNKDLGSQTFGFLKYFGIDELLGWSVIDRAELIAVAADRSLLGDRFAFATASLYYDLQRDFGLPGGLVACAALVFASQIIFNAHISRSSRSDLLISYVPICITLMFWMYSTQYSMLKFDVIIWMSVSFIAFDITNYLLRPKKSSIRPTRANRSARNALSK